MFFIVFICYVPNEFSHNKANVDEAIEISFWNFRHKNIKLNKITLGMNYEKICLIWNVICVKLKLITCVVLSLTLKTFKMQSIHFMTLIIVINISERFSFIHQYGMHFRFICKSSKNLFVMCLMCKDMDGMLF